MIKVDEEYGCLGVVIIMAMNALLGGWAVDVILGWFGKFIPFYGDMIIGLFLGQFAVPVAIVGSILKFFGIF